MRFYVPEWDDWVDRDYDFQHDELSSLDPSERDRDYIWEIFNDDEVPIDGVLISREKVESSKKKAKRLRKHGVYDDPKLAIPKWMPTISDCGAWGYKWLPYPPYGNEEMLEFYEDLDVTTGVTIDHLVLGSGKEMGRLYLDERAFSGDFSKSDLPDRLTEQVEVKIEEWPETWPKYVRKEKYNREICDVDSVDPFVAGDFEGTVSEVLERLEDDYRAVYREDDKQVRYELTLENAEKILEPYRAGDWSFRLMAAFQGWSPQTYAEAAEEVLGMGYRYIGIGGVAGSPESKVKEIVKEVGHEIRQFENENTTRVDTHVFGFSKAGAFDTVGKYGMSSCDSASMLRSAWTGGNNYHLDTGNTDEQYEAIRVRYGSPGESRDRKLEKSLFAQEALAALRAYDSGDSSADAIDEWYETAELALEELRPYLKAHRHDPIYDGRLLRDLTTKFRNPKKGYNQGRQLKASFGKTFRKDIIKLLRADDEDDPIPFEEYEELLQAAQTQLETFPRTLTDVQQREQDAEEVGTFDQVWSTVSNYARCVGDEDYLQAYEKTLRFRPWDLCECPLCTPGSSDKKLGEAVNRNSIEVAIFRGNDRNRRRGFHNTRRFYDRFERDLPKILVVTPVVNKFKNDSDARDQFRVKDYLNEKHEPFWTAVHNLQVAEVGTVDANGFHEWWQQCPDSLELVEGNFADQLAEICQRYQYVYVHDPEAQITQEEREAVSAVDCKVRVATDAIELRNSVLDQLGYDEDKINQRQVQAGLGEF